MERTTHSLLLTPLLYHNLGDLSRGVLKLFSRKFVSRMVGSTQLPRTVRPPEGSQLLGESLPLTSLVYHRPHQKSIGNVTQIREKIRPEVCAKCELTKSERCDIVEMLPGAFDLGQPKTKGEGLPSPNLNFNFFVPIGLEPRFVDEASTTTAPIMATHLNAPTVFKVFGLDFSNLCATSAPRTFNSHFISFLNCNFLMAMRTNIIFLTFIDAS